MGEEGKNMSLDCHFCLGPRTCWKYHLSLGVAYNNCSFLFFKFCFVLNNEKKSPEMEGRMVSACPSHIIPRGPLHNSTKISD